MTNVRTDNVCFLLGIHQRCGTNFLHRLLTAHPDCHGGPIGEDFLIQHLGLLKRYIDTVEGSWNPEWRLHTARDGENIFCHCMGGAISQLVQELSRSNAPEDGHVETEMRASSQLVLSKTPSFGGLSFFAEFFPHAPLLLLVRDGRAVVESGMRSFGWSFEKATREWAVAARRLLSIRDATGDTPHFMIVKYEDLVLDTRVSLASIFTFLGLAEDRYDYERAAGVGVIGSSDLAQSSSVHWDAVPKSDAFKPLDRFRDWSRWRHQRFNWIGGREMEQLGYELISTGSLPVLMRPYYHALDCWLSCRVLGRALGGFARQCMARFCRWRQRC